VLQQLLGIALRLKIGHGLEDIGQCLGRHQQQHLSNDCIAPAQLPLR
jgi:hypothetical protein